MSQFEAFWFIVHQQFPDLKIRIRHLGRFERILHRFLIFVGLVGYSNRLKARAIIKGDDLYVPIEWKTYDDQTKIRIIRSEVLKLRQLDKYG